MEKQREQESRSKKRKNKKIRNTVLKMMGVVVIICLGFCAWVAYYGMPAFIQARIDIAPDENAKTGILHEKEEQEVDIGDFWVLMNMLPTMEEGSKDCNIEYENPDSNRYSARLSLYLKETGELLGNTRRVDPGNYVETVSLTKELGAGEYPVTADLELFEEEQLVGTMSIDITLRIIGKD